VSDYLGGAGVRGNGWICHCGSHHDDAQESVLKPTAGPLHRPQDDVHVLRPARPLPLQRGVLRPGEAALGLLAAEDRHNLGTAASPKSRLSSEAGSLLAPVPSLLPPLLLAEQGPQVFLTALVLSKTTWTRASASSSSITPSLSASTYIIPTTAQCSKHKVLFGSTSKPRGSLTRLSSLLVPTS